MSAALAVFAALASHAAGALLAGICYALPIAVIAWAAIRLLPQCNAATRYGIWLAALVATLALDPLPGHPWIVSSPATSAGHSTSVHRGPLNQQRGLPRPAKATPLFSGVRPKSRPSA